MLRTPGLSGFVVGRLGCFVPFSRTKFGTPVVGVLVPKDNETNPFLKTYQQVQVWKEGRRLKELEEQGVKIVCKDLKVSTKRVHSLLRKVRGLSYREAVTQLQFDTLGIAPQVKAGLERARRKAEEEYDADADKLVVATLYATKGRTGTPKIDIKGRGRFGIRHKKYSHVTIVLKQVEPAAQNKTLKWQRAFDKERRESWKQRLKLASEALGKDELYLTVREVKLWEWSTKKEISQDKKEQVELS